MYLWDYCEVCGKRIEIGQPCIGVKEESKNLCGSSMCMNCVEIQSKELEERCKRLNEARERANEAAHKWETMYSGKKEELEMSQNEVSTMSTAGSKMLDAFSEYVRNGSKNPAAYCYYGAAGCGGDGDGCKGVVHCNFLPKSGMREKGKRGMDNE